MAFFNILLGKANYLHTTRTQKYINRQSREFCALLYLVSLAALFTDMNPLQTFQLPL